MLKCPGAVTQGCDSQAVSLPHGITRLLSDEIAEITDHFGSPAVARLNNIGRYLQTHSGKIHPFSTDCLSRIHVRDQFHTHIQKKKKKKETKSTSFFPYRDI